MGETADRSGIPLSPQGWEAGTRGLAYRTGGIQETEPQERKRERQDSMCSPQAPGGGAGTSTGDSTGDSGCSSRPSPLPNT